MHPALWAIVGIVIYAAGFAITARAANLVDQRWDWLCLADDEDVFMAIVWPLVWLLATVALPLALLYRLATRDLKGD